MDKKGVDLSINVIIVAAIALAVLVILFAIVTGRLGNFTIGIKNTDTCKQKCDSFSMKWGQENVGNLRPDENCVSPNQYFAGKYGDIPDNMVCCCKR